MLDNRGVGTDTYDRKNMMLTDNENKQAKLLDDLASFYVSNTNIDFTPPDSPHKVTPPSSDSEQDPPSTIDQSQLEAFSSLFVNPSQDGGTSTSRRRKNHHPQNRKQSVVAVAMATSVDKDMRRGRRGPTSTARLDCDEYMQMEVPLKGCDGEDDKDHDDNDEEIVERQRQQQLEEQGLSALEKLKRRSQSVDVRRVQRSRSDDTAEMDSQNRRSNSQDARRRARRRNGEGGDFTGDGVEGSLSAVKTGTEGLSALEKLKARSTTVDRRRVAPARSQSDDLLELELRQLCSNQDHRRRHHRSHSDEDDDMSKCTQSTATTKGEDLKANGKRGGENHPVSSRTIDRTFMPPVRSKSSDLIDMDSSRPVQNQRKHGRSFEAEKTPSNEDAAPEQEVIQNYVQPLKSDERSSGSSEKPNSRANSRERRRGVPERSKSDDLMEFESNRPHSNSHGSRRARRSIKVDGDDASVVSTDPRPSSMHSILVRKNSAEGEGSPVVAGGAPVQAVNTDDPSNTSSEKPRSSQSSSRERRRGASETYKSENTPELQRNEPLSSHFGKRRGRRPNGEDASLVESIADTPRIKNSTLDGRGSRHSTRGNRPAHRSRSVDIAFEMDVSRRSATSDEQRRRRQGASSGSRENVSDHDDADEVVKPASDSSLGIDVRKKPQSARDASRIMAMHVDDVDNPRKESLRPDRRPKSYSHAKWSELRQGMEFIDKVQAQANQEERRNVRTTQRDRRGHGHSDTSSVVSSSNKDERYSKSNPRAEKDRDRSSKGPSRPTSERRMQSSTPSSSLPSNAGPVDRMSEATKSDQISISTSHSDKTESQEEKEKVEPKKPQSSAFRTLLGASLINNKKAASSTDESEVVVSGELIADESMHKGRTKGMNVLKKLLAAPSATPSEKGESTDAAKKGTRWGGLRSGVDFTSRLIRSAADSKKTNGESEKVEEATGDGITTSDDDMNTTVSPPQESTKEASNHHHVDGSREGNHESDEISIDRSSNHMRATDLHSRLAEEQAKTNGRNEKADPIAPLCGESTAVIAPELYEILTGARAPDSVEHQPIGNRRAVMTGLAAPSLRFDVNQVDGVVSRFQPDTILEEEEEEDKSNSRHQPIGVPDSDEESSNGDDENEGITSDDWDDEETEDEPEPFLSPLKCMQLKFKPNFSLAGDLLVAIHALDHDQENAESDDDESVKVHGMKMDAFELYYDTPSSVPAETDLSMDMNAAAKGVDDDARQQELATEFEYLHRQLHESRVRIQAANEALRMLQREMQQQTRLLEETKKRGRALKRALREHNVLLLFN